MMHLAIYSTEKQLIDCEETFTTEAEADEAFPRWQLECRNRGGDWKAYKGPEPFAFPGPAEEPADEE